jgi:fructokinase
LGTWPSVVSLGEVLIDFVPVEGDVPIQVATAFRRAAGGAPANVAVALSRLGVDVAFVGKVGGDPFGGFLRQTLAGERVDLRGLVVAPDAQTPLAFVGADGKAGRSFAFYHNGTADTLLSEDEVDRDLIAHARIFHFGSVTLSAEPSRTATLAAAHAAREHGCLVSFDPNVRLELWAGRGRARECITEALVLVDVVKVSADEVQFLTDTSEPADACRRLRALGPWLAVVTLGPDGCYFDVGTTCGHVPAPLVEAVDTLGAGDAFVAGLLVSLLRDQLDLLPALRFANAVGAMATTHPGAIPALPTRAAVEALLSQPRGEN